MRNLVAVVVVAALVACGGGRKGLWPWVRDQAPAEGRVVLNYLVLLDDLPLPLAEFELYILHYLVHAKAHRPEVHDAIVGNQAFRDAFNAVRDGYAALAAKAAALEPTVYAFAQRRGVDVERQPGKILLDGRPLSSADLAPYDAVRAYVDAEPYAAMRATLPQRHGGRAWMTTRDRHRLTVARA